MDPAKDADGLHPTNLGRLVLGRPAPLPCTPRGIVELLRRYGIAIAGADVVVVGRGVTVGRPLGLLLTRRTENATVTLCHTGHPRPGRATCAAPTSIVAAAGVPGLVTAGHGPARAPRCSTSASPAPTPVWSGDVAAGRARGRRASSRRCPAAWGR